MPRRSQSVPSFEGLDMPDVWFIFVRQSLLGNSAMIDLLKICNAQAQLSRRRDVPRAAIEQVLAWVMKELLIVCSDALGIVLPNRRRPFLLPFLLDRLQFHSVNRRRVASVVKSSAWMISVVHMVGGLSWPAR